MTHYKAEVNELQAKLELARKDNESLARSFAESYGDEFRAFFHQAEIEFTNLSVACDGELHNEDADMRNGNPSILDRHLRFFESHSAPVREQAQKLLAQMQEINQKVQTESCPNEPETEKKISDYNSRIQQYMKRWDTLEGRIWQLRQCLEEYEKRNQRLTVSVCFNQQESQPEESVKDEKLEICVCSLVDGDISTLIKVLAVGSPISNIKFH